MRWTAYNDAAGRAPGTTFSGPTDLGGNKLTAGVYKSPTSFGITGTLTLDAQGDPSAVFLFQGGSTLVTAPNSRVALINGASPCNVFWQVGSSATLGVGSTFVGSILALASISANTNAIVQGRLLARNGATTLDSNTVAKPVCAAATSSTLTAEPPVQGLLTLRAGLTETASGAPIVGRTVVMSTSAGPACQAVTDTAGMAACSGAGAAVPIVAEGGYTASFAGDTRFLPASARATLLSAGTGSSTAARPGTPAPPSAPLPSSSVVMPGNPAITSRPPAGVLPATGDARGYREWGLLLLSLGGGLALGQAALRSPPDSGGLTHNAAFSSSRSSTAFRTVFALSLPSRSNRICSSLT